MFYPIWNKDKIVYRLNEEILRIGSDDDDTQEILGNIEVWEDIIKKLDGEKSLSEIEEYCMNKYNISNNNCEEIIKVFYEKHFIDMLDNIYDSNDEFNIYYESLRTYYSSSGYGGMKFLDKLQKMKVTVLGCGAGDSHIAYYLAQSGIGNIHVVDPEVIELKNVNRQALFNISDTGMLKVEAFTRNLKEKNPYVNITFSNKRMEKVIDVKEEIRDSDFVMCCMDEPPYISQRLVNRACYEINIPSIYCFSQKSAGKMFLVYPDNTACIDCFLSKYDNEEFHQLVKRYLSLSDGLITANTSSNISMLCSWVVNKFIDFISGKDEKPGNVLYRFDFHKFKEEIFDEFDKNNICPTCGNINLSSKSILWEIININ